MIKIDGGRWRAPGSTELEEIDTGEDTLREETLPRFSQIREAANRKSEERKDQIFSVENLMQEPSIGSFFF